MSQNARRKRRLAVRLLDQAVGQFKNLARSCNSYQPNTDTSVAMFERYLRRLKELVDAPGNAQIFWSLHQRVHLKLLKETIKLRN
jgi:hypothetical protein